MKELFGSTPMGWIYPIYIGIIGNKHEGTSRFHI